jgi:hypothetical protein
MMPEEHDTAIDRQLGERLSTYRRAREHIERSILPVATSVDGFSFGAQASLHDLALKRGGYVVLEYGDHRRLGQVTDLGVDSATAATEGMVGSGSSVLFRFAKASGVLLDADATPFHDATVRPAEPAEVAAWLIQTQPKERAVLTIGEVLLAPGVPVHLDSGGLNRHTFMCGQSGSGKTYSLGLLLEQILAETTLRVVILDPNSDYVGLPRIREGADEQLVTRYAHVTDEIAVWSNGPSGTHRLRLRFADLTSATQAAVLGLDPIRDREEYAFLAELLAAQQRGQPLITRPDQLADAGSPGARELGMRARNLGVLDWQLWAPDLPSLVEELREPTARCTVVDLGSLDTMQEQRVVAEAVLSTMWETRLRRRPCLIVIDEAHNICAAEPTDDLSRLSRDRAIQIAAEGRKYGLYLLTSTQRPHKVHENVLSQCDNLLLMRMNSQADLTDLARVFSFVPQGLLAGATSFRMGHALVAGKLLPQATFVRMGGRVSEEGGADIGVTWASPPAT